MACATLLGFLGPLWWFFDLFSHFRMQYFLTLLLLVLAFISGRQWKATVSFGLLAALNLATIVPLYLGQAADTVAAAPAYRAMLANVNSHNKEYTLAEGVFQDYDPDILVLLETKHDWLTALPDLDRRYPYSVRRPREDDFGLALFSKFPVIRSEILTLPTLDVPTIKATITLNGRPVTILATHPLPPKGPKGSRWRNEQLAAIPSYLKKNSVPVLLLGDLNVTPWSSHFQRLLKQTGLRNCSLGRGVQPTWPTFLPIFLIPIDHCLHSTDIIILDEHVGRGFGSDHYPLIVDFKLAPYVP